MTKHKWGPRRIAGRVLLVIRKLGTKYTGLWWGIRLGRLGKRSVIQKTVKIYQPRQVRIGDNCSINDFVHIWGGGGVSIGDDTLVAAHTVITSQSHDVDALVRGSLYRETNSSDFVRIGRNVWIGSNATILQGVAIGDNSVVAAGSVVTKSVVKNSLVAGVPARIIRNLG